MKHWHCWAILGSTATSCVGSAAALALLQGSDPPQCNFALIVPFGLAALTVLEAAAYALFCLTLAAIWIARRVF